MPFFHGPVVAGADVSPADWVSAFAPRRGAVVLAPGAPSGWLGGVDLVGCDPRMLVIRPAGPVEAYGLSPGVNRAAELLAHACASWTPALCAALLGYDGSVRVGVFPRGLARSPEGWRAWGDWGRAAPPLPAPVTALPPASALARGPVRSDHDRTSFRRAIEAAQEAMRDGELYVVNLCRRLRAPATASPAVTFATLIARTRAPMAACWCLGDRAFVSASPERFLAIERGLVVVEPIKGTRPRSPDAREDVALERELRASEKERAEHVMVVDLERNDIGRVCAPGSVLVTPLMRVVTTPYCHQLVSTVGGLVSGSASLADVLAATFPCGSVTGAPKRAAMEHIARLERACRGEYTGSLVVAVPGRIDSSVLIRTAVLAGGALSYGVGGGITVDSDPEAEWEETVAKASPLFHGSGRS